MGVVDKANEIKDQGNELLKLGEYSKAIEKYQQVRSTFALLPQRFNLPLAE
jgi:outer membrane protein assembly factor BamD (BamD/ComL family)